MKWFKRTPEHPYYRAQRKGYDLTDPLDMWRWHAREERIFNRWLVFGLIVLGLFIAFLGSLIHCK